MLTHRKSKYRGGVNYFRLGEGMAIENRSDLGRLKTLSIWGMYVLTPKTAQRRGLYCKPTPPVRLTTSSRGDRVPTHPPHGGQAAHGIALSFAYSFTVYALHVYTITPRPAISSFSSSNGGSTVYSAMPQSYSA